MLRHGVDAAAASGAVCGGGDERERRGFKDFKYVLVWACSIPIFNILGLFGLHSFGLGPN